MIEPIDDQPFSKWPLHITIVPWFGLSEPVNDERYLTQELSQFLKHQKTEDGQKNAIEILVGDKTWFGPKLPVMTIEQSDGLINLHTKLLGKLNSLGVKLNNDKYSGSKYQPHITVRGDRYIKTDIKLKINSLTLIKSISEKPKLRQKVSDIRL